MRNEAPPRYHYIEDNSFKHEPVLLPSVLELEPPPSPPFNPFYEAENAALADFSKKLVLRVPEAED